MEHKETSIVSSNVCSFRRPYPAKQAALRSLLKTEVRVHPLVSLVDEKIAIEVIGLAPGQLVTLRAKLTGDSNELFESYGHYIANEEGAVLVSEQESLHGTYSGIDAMGLMWSMKPTPGQKKGLRLSKKDVTKPYYVEVQLYGGHVEDFRRSPVEELRPEASVTFQKYYMSEGVQRIPVREGRLRGTLFLPPGDGPFPGVIDLFGTAGGLIEFKAALLASHGFAALALAYFAYDDLPSFLTNIELEYFFEASNWMITHPKILSHGLGLMGVSKGSEVVLNLASHRSDIKAVVAISPAHAVIGFPIKYKGAPSNFVKFEPDLIATTPNGTIILRESYPDNTTDYLGNSAAIKVENIQGDILLICGADDQSWESERMAKKIQSRLQKHGKRGQCTMLCYDGTGHLIEPPYMPVFSCTYHKTYRMCTEWGGNTQKHALAQEDSWERILNFFSTRLLVKNLKSRL